MMDVMERGGERLKGMAQPCVDHVLKERPCEHSRDETGNAGNHTPQFYPARNRLTTHEKTNQRGAIFLPPEQGPVLSFSACLAENPGSFSALLQRTCRPLKLAHSCKNLGPLLPR